MTNLSDDEQGAERTHAVAEPNVASVSADDLGLYVGAFFDELIRAGVRDVVVSPRVAIDPACDGGVRSADALWGCVQSVS